MFPFPANHGPVSFEELFNRRMQDSYKSWFPYHHRKYRGHVPVIALAMLLGRLRYMGTFFALCSQRPSSVVDDPVELKKVEMGSAENVPMHRRRVSDDWDATWARPRCLLRYGNQALDTLSVHVKATFRSIRWLPFAPN